MIKNRNLPMRRICRGVLYGFVIVTFGISMSFVRKRGKWIDVLQSASDSLTSENEGVLTLIRRKLQLERNSSYSTSQKKEKILVEDKGGRKYFRIEGLPTKKLKEVRKFFAPTTPSRKVKAALAIEAKNIYERRKKRLLESCGSNKSHVWTDNMQLIAVPDKDLSVCVVQKAGSSSWHRLVFKMRETDKTWNGMGHKLNRKHGIRLPAKEKSRLMSCRNGTRVLAVRHPFARLISGWNDKFHKNHLLLSTKILTSLEGIEDYIGRHEPDKDHIIAFEDFAQYLVDKGLTNMDIHFQSIEDLCQPCKYPYDFISKTETSRKNLWWVLERVNAVMPTFTKHTATGSGEDNVDSTTDPWEAEKKVMTAFFKKLPKHIVIRLKEMYQSDFDRFGYTFDLKTLTAGDIID